MDGQSHLKFNNGLIPAIIARNVWMTYRYGFEGPLTPGDELVMLDATRGKSFAKAPVEMVAEMPARQVFAIDPEGHRSYRSVGALVDHIGGFYPEADVGPDTLLDVIEWDPNALNVHPEYRRQRP